MLLPRFAPWLVGLAAGAAVLLMALVLDDGDTDPGGGGGGGGDLPPVDPYAPWETTQPGQCDPTPKPGVLAFRKWVLGRWGQAEGTAAHPTPQNISRDCAIGPNSEHPSEHHEGRAWDLMTKSIEHGQAIVDALLAPDPATGEPHALARRAGVMYLIWNHQMWRAYPWQGAPAGSWGPYTKGEAASPHVDHIHFSFSRAGAAGETSLYPMIDSGQAPNA